jgi:ABC-2 type transport system permease protein
MKRFLWMIRREIWENKAIWVAPLIVIGCLLVLVVTGNMHLGPIGALEGAHFEAVPRDVQVKLLTIVYAGLALVIDMVMGVVAFFYALDSLYADRRDRSVLFWKSLPLSDLETVLSKFAVAAVAIPLVTLAAAVVAQFVVASGGSARLALEGLGADVMWQPQAILGGIAVATLWCVTAVLWYAPVIGYLMLASAWAPRGPFLWAVLPPVAAWIMERVVLYSDHVGEFIGNRLFGMYQLFGPSESVSADLEDSEVASELSKLSNVDVVANLKEFYSSPDLWLGVVVAGLLLAAAMWVRRYRDEST